MLRTSLIAAACAGAALYATSSLAGTMATQIDVCVEGSLRDQPNADIQSRADYVRSCVSDPGATRELPILSYLEECSAPAIDTSAVVGCARQRQSQSQIR